MTYEQFAHDMNMGVDECLQTAQEMARYDSSLAISMLLAAAAILTQAHNIPRKLYDKQVNATWSDAKGLPVSQ